MSQPIPPISTRSQRLREASQKPASMESGHTVQPVETPAEGRPVPTILKVMGAVAVAAVALAVFAMWRAITTTWSGEPAKLMEAKVCAGLSACLVSFECGLILGPYLAPPKVIKK